LLSDHPFEQHPQYLQGWGGTNTTYDPLTRRGILDDQLVQAIEHHQKMSPIRSRVDVEKVLEQPAATAAGDAATIAGATGEQCSVLFRMRWLCSWVLNAIS